MITFWGQNTERVLNMVLMWDTAVGLRPQGAKNNNLTSQQWVERNISTDHGINVRSKTERHYIWTAS
jgi:hypothetical protein